MPPSALKTPALSTIYLNNQRVGLMGDPRPLVAKIVAAGGKSPDVKVLRGDSPNDAGNPVSLRDVIDRTEHPTKAIYLTCTPKAAAGSAGDMAASPAKIPAQYVAFPSSDEPVPIPRGPLPPQPDPMPKPRGPTLAARPRPPAADGDMEWGP